MTFFLMWIHDLLAFVPVSKQFLVFVSTYEQASLDVIKINHIAITELGKYNLRS